MKHLYIKSFSLPVLIFLYTCTYAQNAIVVTGNDVSNNEGSVAYSVGQVMYHTRTDVNVSLSEGVQQPYEISNITAIYEIDIDIDIISKVYPNPTVKEFIILEVEDITKVDLSYQLYDIHGKLLEQADIVDSETHISMYNLAAATYFLHVALMDGRVVNIFKITKAN